MRRIVWQNRKMQVSLTCPTCGMNLAARITDGFVSNGETFCCQGCADRTGCTCGRSARAAKASFNRPGDIGQRNAENSVADKNQNQEVDASGHWFGNRRETMKAPPRQQNRGERLRNGAKAPRSQSEERPSTREQARGRSEQRGSLNKRVNRGEGVDRIAKTGSKSD
jgi:hypothetical protein